MAAVDASTKTRYSLTARFGCAASTVVMGLLAIEVLLRLVGVADIGRGSAWFAGGSHPRFLFVEDSVSGYALRPDFEGEEIAASGEFRVPVRIGSDGLRHAAEAAPATGAVVAVGDSMTFGEGVLEEESWTARLQRSSRTAIVNAGIPGYSSPQMLERIRLEIERRSPSAVLMTFSARWDLGRCVDPFVYREGYIVASSYADRLHLVGENLYLEAFPQPWLARPSAIASGHSALLRLALPRLVAADGGDGQKTRRGRSSRPAWSSYAPCLRAIDTAWRESVAAGASFRLVLIDSPTAAFERDTQTLLRKVAELRVPTIALDDWIAPERRPSLRYPRDLHWNAAGHEAVARALQGALPDLFDPSN